MAYGFLTWIVPVANEAVFSEYGGFLTENMLAPWCDFIDHAKNYSTLSMNRGRQAGRQTVSLSV